MFATNRKYVMKKKKLKNRDYYRMAGVMSKENKKGHPYLIEYSYNVSSVRRNYNKNTNAKIKQKLQNLNIDDCENIQLPQNNEHKKISDYAWWF